MSGIGQLKTWKHRSMAAGLLASASLLAVTPALAQEAAPATDAGNAGEIVVTATKRSENLQNVPISIAAITGDTLAQHQVTEFSDYAKLLPSVSYQSFGPSQSQFYFRGIATGGDGLASGPLPGSGLYIDETPVTTIFGSVDMHAYDVARVEALAGPQGTLYGASSLSGTLRIITNQPEIGKLSAGMSVDGNKYGPGGYGGTVEGFVNVPLGEKMALRVVGFYERDGGYIDNTPYTRTYRRAYTQLDANGDPVKDENGNNVEIDQPLSVNNAKYVKKNFNDVTTAGGRAALKIDLDDNWTVTPAVMYQHQVSHGSFLYGPLASTNNAGLSDPALGDLQVHDFTPDRNRDAWYLASMTIQGKLGNWDVTYAGSYYDRRVDTFADYSYFSVAYDRMYADYTDFVDSLGHAIDPTQVIHTHDKYTKMSHELRISSPASDRLRLTAGLFLQRQTNRHIADYIVPGLSTAVDPPVTPVRGAPGDDVYYTNLNRIDRDYAIFAEGAFDITPTLTLTAGIRGFKADNSLQGFSGSDGTIDKFSQTAPTPCVVLTVTGCPNVDARVKETGETHKVSLAWKAAPSKMVYFTYSTGFRPGGNNRPAFFTTQNGDLRVQNPPPYQSDRLTNYEIGWKTTWFDRKLRFNGALFWEDWDKVQYSLPGIQGIFFTVNAGTARSRGVEADISLKASDALTLTASGTYVDARLTSSFCDVQHGCDVTVDPLAQLFAPAGTRLPVTPKFKMNAAARYEAPVSANDRGFLQVGVNYQSATSNYLVTEAPTPDTSGAALLGNNAAFTTVDFSAGLITPRWTLTAYINNAFDERGIIGKGAACGAAPCFALARLLPIKPQRFGIRYAWKFD
jgi:outer membrane receptor protein involved in Fe transport